MDQDFTIPYKAVRGLAPLSSTHRIDLLTHKTENPALVPVLQPTVLAGSTRAYMHVGSYFIIFLFNGISSFNMFFYYTFSEQT